MRATWKRIAALACAGLAVSAAHARPDFPETEANDTKAAANAVTLAVGDSVSGTTTGTSTTVAGNGSADYYRVKTTAAPLGIYRHRLALSSSTLGQNGTIRGLSQASPGVIGVGDNAAQTSSTTLVAGVRTVQWYGFGKQEEIYYRVTGVATSTATYMSTLSTDPVVPLDLTGVATIYAGDVTIGPSGHTADMDWWLYDSTLTPISCAGMDSGPVPPGLGVRTVSLSPGTYYLAYSLFNFANDQASCAPESFFGTVLDFPNAASNSSTSITVANANARITSLAGTVDTTGLVQNEPFLVNWIKFTVTVAAGVTGSASATPASLPGGASTEFKVTVNPGGSGTLDDIANPPQLSGVRIDIAQVSGSGSPDWLYLVRDGVTADWKSNYAIPALASPATYSLPFEVTQGGVSPSTFTSTLALTILPPPPANDACTGAEVITVVPYVSPLVNFVDATTDTNANPSCDTSGNTAGANRGVWWSFTPASNGGMSVQRNSPTSEDTVTSIWTGADCNSLVQVTTNGCLDGDSTAFNVSVTSGTTYYIMVSKWGSGVPTAGVQVGVTVNFFPPPANDECAGATIITGNGFADTYATAQAGPDIDVSCNSGTASVTNNGAWYSYTPTTNVLGTFAETSSLDTVLAAFTGTDCNALTQIACSDPESLNVQLVAGTHYYFLVGVFSATASASATAIAVNFTETVLPPAPSNDACAGASVISSVPFASGAIANAGATPDVNGSCNTGGATAISNGIWYTYTPAADCNLLYAETTTQDAIFAVFTGADCNSLSQAHCIVAETDNGTFAATAGTQYFILVGRQGAGFAGAADAIDFTLDCQPPPAAPANDLCAGALVISSFPYDSGAILSSQATNDLDVSCNIAAAVEAQQGIWFTWTATAGCSAISLAESGSLDTTTSVFTGDCAGGLTQVHCSDPEASTFSGAPGTQYFILVSRYSAVALGLFDSYRLTATCFVVAPNDTCATALDMTSALSGSSHQYIDMQDTRTATTDGPAGACEGFGATSMTYSIWYKFVASSSGSLTYVVDFGYDSAITGNPMTTIHQTNGTCPVAPGGSTTPAASEIGCAAADLTPITVPVVAGSTYYIMVGDGGTLTDDGCPITLTVDFTPDTPTSEFCCRGTTCTSVSAGTCTGTVAGSSSQVLASCGAGNSSASCCFADYNHTGGVTIDDLFLYLNAYFTGSPYANFGGDTVANPTIDDLFLYINAYFTGCQP